MSVFENVKKLCEKNNISIARLERECNIGNGAISKWKDGPSITTAKKIADYFNVTVDDLLKE